MENRNQIPKTPDEFEALLKLSRFEAPTESYAQFCIPVGLLAGLRMTFVGAVLLDKVKHGMASGRLAPANRVFVAVRVALREEFGS